MTPLTADQYLEHWERRRVWTHLQWPKHQERFRQIAKRCLGRTCIDVGCMYGHSTDNLRRMYPAEWSGVDFSKEAIVRGHKHFPDLPLFYAHDFNALAQLGRWDTVVCSEVLEHVVDDLALAHALLAVTRQVLVVTTPNCRVSDPGHVRIYTSDTLSRLFSRAGATAHSTQSVGTFFYAQVRP